MAQRLFRHMRTHLIAYLALFFALGGTSFAASQALPSNSVGAKQLKKNAVINSKIKNNAVTGAKVKDNSLTGADILESTLAKVPSAASADSATHAGTADSATHAGTADTATNALSLGGIPASGYTQQGCGTITGQIKGFARIVASGGFSSTYTTTGVSVPYNCSGGTVQAKRVSTGEYDVRFNGNPDAFAVVTPAPSTGDVAPNVDSFGISLIGPGEFRIGIFNDPTAALIDDPFIILTF